MKITAARSQRTLAFINTLLTTQPIRDTMDQGPVMDRDPAMMNLANPTMNLAMIPVAKLAMSPRTIPAMSPVMIPVMKGMIARIVDSQTKTASVIYPAPTMDATLVDTYTQTVNAISRNMTIHSLTV